MKAKKLEVSTLFEVLKVVGSIESSQWTRVLEIVDLIKHDKVTIAEKSWHEPYRNVQSKYYPLDLDKIETWSTYDGECVSLKFKIEENTLICNVTIYDGEMLHGYRKNKRFTAKLEFDADYIILLETMILSQLDRLAEREYENHLDIQKFLWETQFKKHILNNSVFEVKIPVKTKIKLFFKRLINY